MKDILLFLTISICLFTDIKKRKIYNKVLVPSLLFGIIINIIGDGWSGLLGSAEGFLLGLGLLFLPFWGNGVGAGDVKLLAVIGAIKGMSFVFNTFLGMALAGGLIGLGILSYQGRLLAVLTNMGRGLFILFLSGFRVLTFRDSTEKNLFPYGIAIAIGVLAAFIIEGR